MWKDKLKKLQESKNVEIIVKPANKPATAEENENLFYSFGKNIPKDLAEFLKECNGFTVIAADGIEYKFLSVYQINDRALDHYTDYSIDNEDEEALEDLEVDKGLKKQYWYEDHWFPIVETSNDKIIFIDIGPASGGTRGQIGSFYASDTDRRLEAKSFDAWFSSFVDEVLAAKKTEPAPKQKEKKDKPAWWKW